MPDSFRGTVLVVDDNPATRYTTSRFLTAAGFKVREAATGQEALELAEEAPQAIILDVNLPDIDGFEVCKIIRSREKTARTPIIHLSATFVGTSDKVQGLEAGADGYLTHPVEPPALVATLNGFLRARSAEESMRRSEEKFRAIFDLAINGIALISKELVFLEVNPSMCRILGCDADSIIGESILSLNWFELESEHEEIMSQLREAGAWSGDLPLIRSDGKVVALNWHISFHSRPGILLAEVADITERRAAEVEREHLLNSERAARTELERANRLKDEFLATISHELRSPLNAIVGWARFLKVQKSTDIKDYFAGIEAIDRNAQAQAQLIGDLLDVSSIAAGKMRLEFNTINLADIVRHAVEGASSSAEAKSVSIRNTMESDTVIISGDAGRIQQVLYNLLTNAIKFTPTGGQISVVLQNRDGLAEVHVADTGQGISSEFQPFIFDSFRQEDASISRSHEGLGLGLAIVKRIVEMHGGSVDVKSEGKDKGSTFTLRLPLSGSDIQSADGDSGQRPTFRQHQLEGLRVLVVEDDDDARFLIRRILSEHGAVVTEASTASQAMSIVEISAPQLLVSDIGMPDTDGYQLIRRIRLAGHAASRLPAIAVTAFARPEDRNRVLAMGYQAHLRKPFDPDLLIHIVAQLTSGTFTTQE